MIDDMQTSKISKKKSSFGCAIHKKSFFPKSIFSVHNNSTFKINFTTIWKLVITSISFYFGINVTEFKF